jgi:hypothetical protein
LNRYEPADSFETPRFSGVREFLSLLVPSKKTRSILATRSTISLGGIAREPAGSILE